MTKRKGTPPAVTEVDAARVQRIVLSAHLFASRVAQFKGRAADEFFRAIEGREWNARMEHGVTALEPVSDGKNRIAGFLVGVRCFSSEILARDREPAFQLEVVRIVAYANVPEDASRDELLAFGMTTAVYNAWPMLRADVLDLASRMSVPNIVLPLLRVGSVESSRKGPQTRQRPAAKRPKPSQGQKGRNAAPPAGRPRAPRAR